MGVIATVTGHALEDAPLPAQPPRAHDRVARLAATATGAATAFIALVQEDGLKVTGVHGMTRSAAETIVTQQPLLFSGMRRTPAPVVHRTLAAAPVTLEGDVVGLCCVAGPDPLEMSVGALEALTDVAAVLAADVDEARRLEQHARRVRWERDQRAVLESIAAGEPVQRTLDLLLRQMEAYSEELLCSILLLDGDQLFTVSAPRLPAEYSTAIDGVRIGPAVGSCGTAAYRGEQVIVEDIATDPLWKDYKDLALDAGLRACWSTPILGADGGVLGSFAIYYGRPRRPDVADLDLIAQVTNLASIALTRDRNEAALRAGATAAATRAAEQSALRRVATAIAEDITLEQLFDLVAREAAEAVGADAAGIGQLLPGGSGSRLVGSWTAEGTDAPPIGTERPIEELPLMRTVRDTGAAVHLAADQASGVPFRLGAPIRLGGELWGILAVVRAEGAFGPADRRRLIGFCDLVATRLVTAAAHAHLNTLAATDPLTGLANHRVFQERLRGAVANAARHGDNVGLAVFDLDGFKGVNDEFGHQEGDRVLTDVADVLRGAAREGDLVARLGGDEFALLMPGADAYEATAAAERIRALVAATDLGSGGHGLTLSAGTSDLVAAPDAEELLHHADSALYTSKAQGRDLACMYSPTQADGMSHRERASRLARSRTRMGLRALARAIDARDPMTQRHSERVATVAAALAQAAGWSAERVALLREAALIHDVGKVAVSDAILSRPGPLSDEEMEIVRGHAILSEQIAADVVTREQAAWIRSHHERPDGTGYPDGLTEDELSEGVQLLSLADAWDAMRSDRPHRDARDAGMALAECRALVGRQFTARAVELLQRLHDEGRLPGA